MSAQHSEKFLTIVGEAKSRIAECTVADVIELQAKDDAFILIDVREDNEFANSHIPGAMHLGKGVIERDIQAKCPDIGAKLILYCGGGFRSALAADSLQKMGYYNVISMDGGFRHWKESGHPTS
jgi:rhodanese-related sulfurtransferase